jgi:molybdenum cofactor biosynthesis enzyme MoaA
MGAARVASALRPALARYPALKHAAKSADLALARARQGLATHVPGLIRAEPRQITIAITADCNLRCTGCGYGRDFMPGERLPLETVRQILDDAAAAGIGTVRFYGGEPLLHRDLPAMVAHAKTVGLQSYVTTNGTQLGRRIEALYNSGLRTATVGFYGLEPHYTTHTGRAGHFERLERSLETVRTLYGSEFSLQLNFVVMRGTTNVRSMHEAWAFAERFGMVFHLDLAGTTIPFFQSGGVDLSPREEDRADLEALSAELVRLKGLYPARVNHSVQFLRSVPDWMLKGTDMRVPCNAYHLLWIGADGSIQLCDTSFPLGNVHRTRLREVLFNAAHQQAARDGFQLKCPNCTCLADPRIVRDQASYRRYSRPGPQESAHG